ncbi:hypothetical protein AC579_1959 [Pseudocercospora musae]|uniref:Uncharacterized protein n=1 Tax=Pseudocercospora musae TaxID=113226 RepID=A0A139I827_9PEZI|nr:hypothetical protein AC579_1959 [Pseudocercospora musae]
MTASTHFGNGQVAATIPGCMFVPESCMNIVLSVVSDKRQIALPFHREKKCGSDSHEPSHNRLLFPFDLPPQPQHRQLATDIILREASTSPHSTLHNRLPNTHIASQTTTNST